MFFTSFFLTKSSYKNYSILFSRISQHFFLDFWNIFCQSLRKVDLTMFSTFEKIKELCKKQGISLNQLEDKLGFSQNYIYSIKKGNPKVENLQKIADYFKVSTDYLLGRTDNPRIATDNDVQEIDFKEMAAESMSYDGMPLNDEDIDLIASILELIKQHFHWR